MEKEPSKYYLPNPSFWPIIGCIALVCMAMGGAHWLHGQLFGPKLFVVGALILWVMLTGWFGTVIGENLQNSYNKQVDSSFRWAMGWFIFSEVCFFGVFFGALFYIRVITVPMLGSIYSDEIFTHLLLWPDFVASWPVLIPPDLTSFMTVLEPMKPWGLPAINTLILLTSGLTITIAHHGLIKKQHKKLVIFMLLTVLLGISFLILQAHEYIHAYTKQGLTLHSGIYGATFFLLTGFHGLHVTIGTLMLIVISIRCIKRHFTPNHHFAFEATAWYWHFVDVVWLGLFIFVYWL